MSNGPSILFTQKQQERSAKIMLHKTILEKPPRAKPAKQGPGSYALPKPPGAALPCTLQLDTNLVPIKHQYVREGGNDFLKLKSRGAGC